MTAESETSNVATAVAAVQVRDGKEGAFAGWLSQLNKTIATFPGYISAVVIPPVPPAQSDWVMVQRFQTIEQLRAWLESDARRSLLDEVASLLVDEGTTNVIEGSNTELSPQDMVTEIITVGVKPGMEEAYRAWVDRVRQMEARFPGYQGLQLQPPIPGLQDNWVSLLRFDTAEHLDAWLESDARREALREVEPFIDRREQQVATAFSGWFTFGDVPGRQATPSWKQSMIVLLMLFPIVMLELLYLRPLLQSLGIAESTFVSNLLSVAATGFVLVPIANRVFGWWLRPMTNGPRWVTPAGVAIIFVLYAISVVVFTWLS
jgi:antibiotic biosynthesis monooxygenase (ABM) superfamily enzyme